MIRKKIPVIVHVFILARLMIRARGSSRVISTSKIKKIKAIKKKRSENGNRADPWGSNPHSNGEFFSRSLIIFLLSVEERSMMTREISEIKMVVSVVVIITFSESFRLIGWRPIILNILKKLSTSSVD